ncbi:leucine-rich transmembrane protein, partial [Euroglyphus maynei]
RLLSPLRQLEHVELSYLRLDSHGSSTSDLFAQNRQTLRHVNLSHNSFVNISIRLLDELYQIEVLDLSHNSLYELSSSFLYILNQYRNLSLVFFDQNPWSCYRCHLLYFRNWITTPFTYQTKKHNAKFNMTNDGLEIDANSMSPILLNPYQKACQIYDRCAVCRYPPNLDGIRVDLIEDWKLEWCTDPTVQLRVSTTEPNVGLVLALLIIITLIIVIICVIVYYRNRGAIYFTNEELLYGRTSGYDDGTTSGGGGIMHQPHHKSSVYNISNAIRYFADATATPPDTMSVTSADSLYHPNSSHYHRRDSLHSHAQHQ